ncbi:MAG: DNA repair protein RecO [Bacillota bacterium]|nr:DNA repair protein RecO [Bacillota bacterium]
MSAYARERLDLRGLVLARRPYGEADLFLTILNPERGLLELGARGIRRQRQGQAAAVELAVLSRFQVFDYRGRLRVDQAELEYGFPGLRQDIVRLTAAGVLAELSCDLFADASVEQAAPLWELLLHAFHALEEGPEERLRLTLDVAVLRLLALGGFPQRYDACVLCGRLLPEGAGGVWSFADHGLLCRVHEKAEMGRLETEHRAPPVMALSPALLRALVWYQEAPPSRLFQTQMSPGAKAVFHAFVRELVGWTVERPGRSWQLLGDLIQFQREAVWPRREVREDEGENRGESEGETPGQRLKETPGDIPN